MATADDVGCLEPLEKVTALIYICYIAPINLTPRAP